MIVSIAVPQLLSAQDRFAEIGTREYQTREHLLVEPQPIPLPDIDLPVFHNASAVFDPVKPINKKEELYKELDDLKRYYQPFLRDIAPPIPLTREKILLEVFNWRIATDEDRKDFTRVLNGSGDWEKITVPHYGPPLGRAETYYFKKFNVSSQLKDEQLYICFNGVDYKTSVFVNGGLAGSHEGFFAPFEFNISSMVRPGENTLLLKVENDFSTTGEKDDRGNKVIGDKIYGATGPGYDDPELGWHHCPPAMGIYQDCYLETRADLHINEIFVRPLIESSEAEIWVEVNCMKQYPEKVRIGLEIYGQNFEDTVLAGYQYIPSTVYIPGVGDLAKPQDWEERELTMEHGVNYLRIPVSMKDFRLWEPDNPWLYQVQVQVLNEEGSLMDAARQQFGMRSFHMDTVSIPKGNMYLNGEMIRLRGANTMGHLQQCVIRKDWDQLVDDILLAKLSNMNFLRFTQRPVQSEIYQYCDMLGMLNQTDLPLFGALRRNKFAEAVKQTEEMERLIRSHPSAIMVTYINERFPNAEGKPHRSMNTAEEYLRLFKAFDQAVLLSNPDRVIKAGDGDYDPPSPGLPDSHAYNLWYNGHGLGVGKMYKGYWQLVKPDWNYGCGEFGTEGLDPLNVMYKYYPEEWLPKSEEDRYQWDPSRISMAQSKKFHYMWYNTPGSIEQWVQTSQDYQAWATKFTTESFRRDPRMVSIAIHLFIDAWPAGWMKTIMDVDRQPKKAYFAYRDALEPLMVSLRSDRSHFYSGEKTAFEIWIANDLNLADEGYSLHYQMEKDGEILFANSIPAKIPVNSSQFQGFVRYEVPEVNERTSILLRSALKDQDGKSVYQNEFPFEVFPEPRTTNTSVYIFGDKQDLAAEIIDQAGIVEARSAKKADVLIIDDFSNYLNEKRQIDRMVHSGKKLLFLELAEGTYEIGGTEVVVSKTEMGDYYFVSPQSGHPMTDAYEPYDFRFWHDNKKEYITPLLSHNMSAPEWTPILTSGFSNWVKDEGKALAVAELKYGKGTFRICEVLLKNRFQTNPVARDFFFQILEK